MSATLEFAKRNSANRAPEENARLPALWTFGNLRPPSRDYPLLPELQGFSKAAPRLTEEDSHTSRMMDRALRLQQNRLNFA